MRVRFIAGPLFDAGEFLAGHRDRAIRELHGDGGWAYFTDLDEFPQLDVERELAHARRLDVPYVAGRWVDRVAPQGRLVAVDPARPLEEQYPFGCRVSGHYRMLDNVYVLAAHAPYSHHPSVCAWGAKWWPQCAPVDVHHFRWQANLADRLRCRFQRVDCAGAKRWANNIGRMQRYLEQHQGVDPSRLAHLGELIGC